MTALSGGVFMSGKEQLDQEIPIPPEIEKWINTADMQYDNHKKYLFHQKLRNGLTLLICNTIIQNEKISRS